MYTKKTLDRSQPVMFTSLEDIVGDDNPVRVIDLFIENLSKSEPEKFSREVEKKDTGRRPYRLEDLCKLYLYGYLNRISSSRRLETETHRNLEVGFLMSGEMPDHKTIANFRKDRGDLIRFICLSFRRWLKEKDYISGHKAAIDGTKVKACTSADSVISLAKVSRRMADLEKRLEEYLSQMQACDTNEDVEESLSSADETAANIAAIEAKILELEKIKRLIQANGGSDYCPNDPDAHLMKTRDGFKPAYNVQTVTDAKYRMIVLAEVTDSCNDINELEPCYKRIEEELGTVPKIIEADSGYCNIEQIRRIEEGSETVCAIPPAETWSKKQDAKTGVSLRYSTENDTLVCSEGKTLRLLQKNCKIRSTFYNVYRGNGKTCETCRLFGKCTGSHKGRIVKVSVNEKWKAEYVRRLQTAEYKKLIKERKALIEHVFGTVKRWMGKVPLLLVGKRKVQTETDLYTTAYNFRRLFSITPVPLLMQQLACCEFKCLADCLFRDLRLFFSVFSPGHSQRSRFMYFSSVPVA